MDKKKLLDQRAALEKQLREELRACRLTRRKIDAINLLVGEATDMVSGISRAERSQNTQVAAFGDSLETILETDHRERNVMEAVRQALEDARGTFTARTLVETINSTAQCSLTERDVVHPLWRLQKLGVIRVFKRGSGRRPNVYLKP